MSDSFVLDNWMLKFLMEHTAKFEPSNRPIPEPRSIPRPTAPYLSDGSPVLLTPFGSAPMDSLPYDTFAPTGSQVDGLGDGPITGSLGALLHEQNLSNEAVVENALSWLLDQDMPDLDY